MYFRSNIRGGAALVKDGCERLLESRVKIRFQPTVTSSCRLESDFLQRDKVGVKCDRKVSSAKLKLKNKILQAKEVETYCRLLQFNSWNQKNYKLSRKKQILGSKKCNIHCCGGLIV